MQLSKSQSVLTPEERIQKRKLVAKDSLALFTLLIITLTLFTATLFLFRSFSDLRTRLAKRWLARGELALRDAHYELAVEDLRSALAYSPGQRSIEVELAEALAGAGRTQEATSYFNTLWEAEPGSGVINLQLARLAATQGDEARALEHYHASIYGTWEGDGSVRRRDVRIELIDYLISNHRFDQARSELLIASGNAPDNSAIKLQIAALMEKAGDPGNALRIYKTILQHGAPNLRALEGAGRSAFALGNYVQARDYIQKALAHPAGASESAQSRQDLRDLLEQSVATLLLYPSPALSTRAQAERVLRDRSLVFQRLGECGVPLPGALTPAPPVAAAQSAANTAAPAATPPSSPAAPPQPPIDPDLAAVLDRWQALPAPPALTVPLLQNDEGLRQAVQQLVYDTEVTADKACAPPTAENALLNKISQNPGAVEAQ